MLSSDSFSFFLRTANITQQHFYYRLLDSMDGDFDSTSGFLGGTLNRVNKMVSSGRGNRKIMCYVILGVILTIFFLYLTIKKLASGDSSGGLWLFF